MANFQSDFQQFMGGSTPKKTNFKGDFDSFIKTNTTTQAPAIKNNQPAPTIAPIEVEKPKSLIERVTDVVTSKLNSAFNIQKTKTDKGTQYTAELPIPARFGPAKLKVGITKKDNPVIPQAKEFFLPTSTGKEGETFRTYVSDTGKQAVEAIKGVGKLTPPYFLYRAVTGNPVTPKEYVSTIVSTSLDTLGTLWRVNPAAPIVGAELNYLKTLRQKAQGKEITWEDVLNSPLEGVTKQPGFGELVTDNVKVAQAIDIAFLVVMVGKPLIKSKLNSINARAEEISQVSKTLGVKPNDSLSKVANAWKEKMRGLSSTFTNDPIPAQMKIRTELNKAYEVLKRAGVVEKKYASAYDFLNSKFGPKDKVAPSVVSKPKELPSEQKPKVPAEEPVTREIIKVDKTKYPGIESGMAVVRPDKTASLDVRFTKEAQGKGQGTEVVKELESKLSDKGITEVNIDSFPEAVGFWEKQGYTKVGEVKPGENVKMTKDLSESTQIPAKSENRVGESGEVKIQAQKDTPKEVGDRGEEKSEQDLFLEEMFGEEIKSPEISPNTEIKFAPYRGQIGQVEKQLDELIGFTSGNATTLKQVKQNYAERMNLLEEAKVNAPPDVIRQIEKYEKQLETLRDVRLAQKDLANNIKELTDAEKQKIKDATIEASRGLKAIKGTGEFKTRGLSRGVSEKAVKEKLTRTLKDLPEYQTLNLEEQARKAVELLKTDPERALRIALGMELPPNDITPEAVFVAVENQAIINRDIQTIKDLATLSKLTSEATTMGQRIRTLGERDPDSPVTIIRDITETKKEAFEKRMGRDADKAIKDEVAKIKKEIKLPDKYDWAKFLNEIEC